jgi:hypothetical protein
LISTSPFQVRSAVTMVPFLMTLDICFPAIRPSGQG